MLSSLTPFQYKGISCTDGFQATRIWLVNKKPSFSSHWCTQTALPEKTPLALLENPKRSNHHIQRNHSRLHLEQSHTENQ